MEAQPGTATALDAEPVPHVEPLTDDQLNKQISDVFTDLIKHAHDLGQKIATENGLTRSDAMALFKLETPMTMKELGQRMGCDPSFVTTIADALEKHGLARREPSLRDRRSKNIVLTPEGEAVRERLFREFLTRAPWCTALDTGERRCLLGLMRKMLRSCGGRGWCHSRGGYLVIDDESPAARSFLPVTITRGKKNSHGEHEPRSVRTKKSLGTHGTRPSHGPGRDRSSLCPQFREIVLSAQSPDAGRVTREVSKAAASDAVSASGVAGAPPRRLGLALAVIATAQLMVVLDATIVNVALPHIQTALGFSGTNLEWVVNPDALVFGGLLLLGGRSGDLLGRRRIFIAGLLLFSLASLLGGFATDPAWLIIARGLQGAGAAMAATT